MTGTAIKVSRGFESKAESFFRKPLETLATLVKCLFELGGNGITLETLDTLV